VAWIAAALPLAVWVELGVLGVGEVMRPRLVVRCCQGSHWIRPAVTKMAARMASAGASHRSLVLRLTCVSSGTGVHAVHPRQIGVGHGPAPRSYGTGSLVGVVGTECRGQCESLVTVAAGVNEPVRVSVDDIESVE
jgi:hypothetical protein